MLYVEDSPSHQAIVKTIIAGNGLPFVLTIAENVSDARRILEEQFFDVLLLDFQLPDGTAFDLFESAKGAPIVVLTSEQDPAISASAVKQGAHNFLLKQGEVALSKVLPKAIFDAARELRERESLEVLSLAFHHLSDAVFITDPKDRIIYVNRAFIQRYGYSSNELHGKHVRVLWEDPNSEPSTRSVPKEIEGVWIYNRAKSGKRFPVFMSRSVIESSEGLSLATVGVAREVSELTKAREVLEEAEQKRRTLEEQLRHSQKLEAVGQLAGGIAHDFNNILGSIVGYTEMALEDLGTEHEVSSNLNESLKAAFRAKRLISQILTFSRRKVGGRVPIDLVQLVRETGNLLRATFPSTINMVERIEAERAVVNADCDAIQSALVNLATNASFAMRESGGTLEISLWLPLDPSSAKVGGRLLPWEASVFLSVSDTGEGMSEQTRERAFEPFYTTKGLGEGTGLGLSVVHGIITEHLGSVALESELGKGTRVVLSLPTIETEVETKHYPEGESEPIVKGQGRVLFIDDEESLVNLGNQMLKRLGYECECFSDGLEALKRFQSQPESFDLVITDQTMPAISGQVLAEAIWQIRKEVPIILCTGFSDTVDQEQANQLGFAEFLPKPVTMRRLGKALSRALSKNH